MTNARSLRVHKRLKPLIDFALKEGLGVARTAGGTLNSPARLPPIKHRLDAPADRRAGSTRALDCAAPTAPPTLKATTREADADAELTPQTGVQVCWPSASKTAATGRRSLSDPSPIPP